MTTEQRRDYQLLEAVTTVKHFFFFFFKPTQLKFFGDLTLYHSSDFTVAEASKFQDLHSPPSSRTQPGPEGSPLLPTPTAGFRTGKSRPRDPLRKVGVDNGDQIKESCPTRLTKTGATCFNVSVAGGKREVAISSR